METENNHNRDIEIRTIESDVEAQIIEKKSRFIANVYKIETKEEAETILGRVKKQYKDAKHYCFAFCVLENGQNYTKSSDDGEPSGTAGVPILNVIQKTIWIMF